MTDRTVYLFPSQDKATLSEVGGKGLSLMTVSKEGLPVPPGFIVTTTFFKPWLLQLKTTDAWSHFLGAKEDELEKACDALKIEALRFSFSNEQQQELSKYIKQSSQETLFAVRSSSPEEDLEGSSFAGGYETILGVDVKNMEDAVKRAFASCLDYRVAVYKRKNGFDITNPKIAVIVQKQIASEVSGVGFSINPFTNNYDDAIFTANWGLGETVVAGIVTPDTYIVDKVHEKITQATIGSKELSIWLNEGGGTEEKKNFRSTERCLTDAQVITLTQLIKKVENHYHLFMDIEWAFVREQVFLLQARPVTSYVPLAPDVMTIPGQKKRLYFDITVTAQGMEKPLSKIGTSVFRQLLKVIGRTIFMRDLSRDINRSVPWLSEGKLYFNLSTGLALVGKKKVAELMMMMDPLASKAVENLDEKEYVSTAWKIMLLPYGLLVRLPRILLFIRRAQRDPENVHAWVQGQLKQFEKEVAQIAAKDAPLHETLEQLLSAGFKRVFLFTLPLTIASRFTLTRMRQATGNNPEVAKLEVALPNNMTTEMGLALAHVASLLPDGLDAAELKEKITTRALPEECMSAWRHFLAVYGHRGPSEVDPAAPRYRDDTALLLNLMLAMKNSTGENTEAKFERNSRERAASFQSLFGKLQAWQGNRAESFAKDYRFFETFGGYRETHKHYLVLIMAIMRQKILAQAEAFVAAKRLDSTEQVFDLTLEQLEAARIDSSMDLRKLASENTVFLKKLARLPRPPALIDSRGFIPRPPVPPTLEGEYVGVGVSAGVVRGHIKVLHTPTEKPLLKGEILVARSTDPGWTPLFVNAGGVILEIGGLLQHGALVAREYGLPCVAGIDNSTSIWKDGTLVEVDGSAGIVRLVGKED